MEHGKNSQSAPADKNSVGDTPSSPYHLLYSAAASAPDHDISEVAVRAALTTPTIDAMTDPRAVFGADGASKYHHVTTAPKQPRRPDSAPQSSVGPELVPARMGEEYTYCGRACCSGDHRVKRLTRDASAAASLSSCGKKEGGWEGSAPRGIRSVRYHWSRRPDGKVWACVTTTARPRWSFMMCGAL